MVFKILLIDDEPDMMDVIVYRLKKAGYEVSSSQTAAEGLAHALSFQPDLILLDFRLPDMTGDEVCKLLKSKKETCHIPVVFVSASSERMSRALLDEVGACDYFIKPFKTEQLLQAVATYIKKDTP